MKVSYSLAVPNGVLIQNYGKVSKERDISTHDPPVVPAPTECSCRHYRTDGTIDFKGHVVTTDPGFITDVRLRSYWLKGRKFRCQAHPQLLLDNLRKNLDTFILQAAKRNKMDGSDFLPWRDKLLDLLSVKFAALSRESNAPYHSFLTPEGMSELQKIHKEMVVTYADKSSHDFVLCCKPLYKRLLWEEIHSEHYATEQEQNETLWNRHALLSNKVGQNPVHAHRYLYGILKMHKNPVGVRWIAGNHLQEMGEPGYEKKFPACSLSNAEMTIGGILRMCMDKLRRKDFACRKLGYKRYWTVTNVDEVAADIKHGIENLRGKPVFTRDFTRMYTSIPQHELVRVICEVINEVFQDQASVRKMSLSDLRVKVKYPKSNHSFAFFDEDGFSFEEIRLLLEPVCSEVFFQQGDGFQLLRQKQGLPMGGKASAELANLFCYYKESRFIDNLIQQGKLDEAKSWYWTWRYIDDLLGFGRRENGWQNIDYGMEHIDTTDSRFCEESGESQAVFLGMRISNSPGGLLTSVQPKGEGWVWLPRKFIEYSSCHTHYTKWYMLKGLLIRALTICNSEESFFKAVIHYAQGLISRGFPSSSLLRAWKRFAYEKIHDPRARKKLTARFMQWVEDQDFSHAYPDEAARQQGKYSQALTRFKGTLMCGLVAVNNIMKALKIEEVTAAEIHTLAKDMAQRECSLIYAQEANMVLDLEVDPRGNYAVDVLLQLLGSRTGSKCTRWVPGDPLTSSILLIGSGVHWQAILRSNDGLWFLYEQSYRNAVSDIFLFLEGKVLNGAVYLVGEFQDLPETLPGSGLSGRLRTVHNLATPPPPSKRPRQSFQEASQTTAEVVWSTGSTNGARRRIQYQNADEHRPMKLPEEFMSNPLFSFIPPNTFGKLTEREPFDELMEVLSEDDSETGTESRPQRSRTRTQLYQAEEEEKKEKEKRAVKGTEKNRETE